MNTPILEVSDIQKYYGNKGNITKAVNRISLSASKGELNKIAVRWPAKAMA